MARILIGATGSVAAVRIPGLVTALRDLDHEVRVVATEPALHFFDPADCDLPGHARVVYRDRDEWPGSRYAREDPVLHIAFRDWADALLIAPLDANSLAKIALGLSDNFLTCIVRAWSFPKPLLLAPAMNTAMWDSPVTRRHFATLLADRGANSPDADWRLENVADVFAECCPAIRVIAPIAKRLACGDEGVGAMAEIPELIAAVETTTSGRAVP